MFSFTNILCANLKLFVYTCVYYCFLCKASHESILIDEINSMFNIHVHTFTCTCTIQLQILVYKNMYVTFKFYAGTWHKDYNVMLNSEV